MRVGQNESVQDKPWQSCSCNHTSGRYRLNPHQWTPNLTIPSFHKKARPLLPCSIHWENRKPYVFRYSIAWMQAQAYACNTMSAIQCRGQGTGSIGGVILTRKAQVISLHDYNRLLHPLPQIITVFVFISLIKQLQNHVSDVTEGVCAVCIEPCLAASDGNETTKDDCMITQCTNLTLSAWIFHLCCECSSKLREHLHFSLLHNVVVMARWSPGSQFPGSCCCSYGDLSTSSWCSSMSCGLNSDIT